MEVPWLGQPNVCFLVIANVHTGGNAIGAQGGNGGTGGDAAFSGNPTPGSPVTTTGGGGGGGGNAVNTGPVIGGAGGAGQHLMLSLIAAI